MLIGANRRAVFLNDVCAFGGLRPCLSLIDGIYYAGILERKKANFAIIVGRYGKKINEVAA